MQNTMVLGKNNNVVLRILFPLVICRSVKLGPSQRNIPQIIFCYQIKEQVLISDFVWLWGFRIQKPSYLAIGSSLVSNNFQFIVSWGCLRNFLMGLLPTPNQENRVFTDCGFTSYLWGFLKQVLGMRHLLGWIWSSQKTFPVFPETRNEKRRKVKLNKNVEMNGRC